MALLRRLFDAIVDGKAQLAQSVVEEELRAGAEPMALVSETMIPAMDEVGKLFQEEEFFVPELMLSGRAMKAAMEPLRPLLAAQGTKPAGVVVVGTLKGIIVAIIVSLVTLAYQVADPPVYVLRRKPGTNVFRPQSPEHPEDESFPGLLLLRPEGPIFFANAAQIAHKIEPLIREAQPKVVAVDSSGVIDVEYTALKMFAEVAKRQSQHGVQLWLVGMSPRVLAIVQRSPLGQLLRRERMHFNLEIAVARYLDHTAVRDQS